jgi:hypothetical protein
MEEFNPELFQSLPLEMQEQIIIQRPELLRSFSQTNSEYGDLLERSYFNQICNMRTKGHESRYIMNKLPTKITLHQHRMNQENGIVTAVGYVISISQLSIIQNHPKFIEIISDNIQGVEIRPNARNIITNYRGSLIKDLWQYYNIWANRLNCMRIDPNYAKDRTLAKLNEFWGPYNNFINTHDNIDFQYKNQIIFTYLYMFMNKFAFNILDNSDLTKLIDIERNIDDIMNDIQYLYETIIHRIFMRDLVI